MPRTVLTICLGLICYLLGASPALAQGKYLDWRQMETAYDGGHPINKYAFSGTHNGVVLVAGGRGPDGSGSSLYIGKPDTKGNLEWQQDDLELDQDFQYDLSISTPEGLICIGLSNKKALTNSVHLLQWDAITQKAYLKTFPDLPANLVDGTAAWYANTLYVTGSSLSPRQEYFFSLDLLAKPKQRNWKTLPTCPGAPRTATNSSIQSNGMGPGFYLFGGRVIPDEDDTLFSPDERFDTWRFDLKTHVWEQMANLEIDGNPYSALNSPTVKAGVHHILTFQARNIQAVANENLSVLAYHTVTNTWAIVDTLDPKFQAKDAFWLDGKILLPGSQTAGISGWSPAVWEITPVPVPFGLRWLDYGVIVLYLLILVAMGAHFMRRGKTTEDYFKAGKRIPWWAAGISIFGTSLSAITYMAVPAKAFGSDWAFIFLSVSQVLTVPLVIWLVLPFYRRLNVTTAYEYLERRFHVVVRTIGSIAFLLFQFGRIGIVLFLPAIALSVVTGINIETCIIVMAVLSIFYTVLGGIEAVIWTDVKQVVVLTVGAIVCLILITTDVGGVDHLIDLAAADGKLKLVDLDFDFQSPTLWVILGGGIGTNLINQTSDQTFVQRYLTTKTEKSAARSLLTPAVIVIPVSILFFGLGTALYGFYKINPDELNPALENADAIFPWYIISQLPQGMSGLLIAGIFAASMSSLDSSLNSAATVVTVDFYKRFRPERSDKKHLQVARIATVVIGIMGMGFALLLAGSEVKSLWDEFSKVLGLFAGGLAGLFLLGMSSRRATTGGALIGFAISSLIQYWVSSTGAVHFLLYTLTGLASCYGVGWLASWLFPAKKNLFGLTISTIRQVPEETPPEI